MYLPLHETVMQNQTKNLFSFFFFLRCAFLTSDAHGSSNISPKLRTQKLKDMISTEPSVGFKAVSPRIIFFRLDAELLMYIVISQVEIATRLET